MHRTPGLALLCFATTATATATATAQGALQASLTALAPIVVSGSGGAPVSFPAGPLTSALVQGPSGTTAATFSCNLINTGTACTLQANAGLT